jgi:hypothetical protein
MSFAPFESGTGLVRFHSVVGSDPAFSTSLASFFATEFKYGRIIQPVSGPQGGEMFIAHGAGKISNSERAQYAFN